MVMIDLDEGMTANNIRLVFDVLNALTRSKQSRPVQIEYKNGNASN